MSGAELAHCNRDRGTDGICFPSINGRTYCACSCLACMRAKEAELHAAAGCCFTNQDELRPCVCQCDDCKHARDMAAMGHPPC